MEREFERDWGKRERKRKGEGRKRESERERNRGKYSKKNKICLLSFFIKKLQKPK